MKKIVLLLLVASAVLFASCGAALTGAYLGGSLGSAIGGISNGPRGHDVGMLVGTVGGAMIGAAVESAAEQKAANQRDDDMQKYREEKARLAANRQARQAAEYDDSSDDNDADMSGFDGSNSGDDRIDIDFGQDDSYIEDLDNDADNDENTAKIEIQNIRFIDSDESGTIQRGEQCEISFEIYNSGNITACNIEPAVTEKSAGGHIQVSPSILIESLAAGKGVRYTARVKADNSLKDGAADFEITVTLDGQPTDIDTGFSVPTSKK